MAFDMAPKGRLDTSRPRPLSAGFRIVLWVYVALITVFLILPVIWNIVSPGGHGGESDFVTFYAAAELTLEGDSAAAFDDARLFAQQRGQFPGRDKPTPYFYPPSYMLMVFWLPFLPYVAALAAFLGATFALFLAALRPWLDDRYDFILVLAAPPVWINVAHGQNAFLTTALALFCLRWLGQKDFRAGAALGLLSVKPHLCLLWPFILLARGNWRAILAGAAMTVLLVALSAAVFGIEAWRAFFDAGISRAYGNLSQSLANLPWIASPHAGMIGLGFSREAALAVQLASTGAVIALLVHLCRIGAPLRFVFALALTAALFVTPHNYPYDWVIVLAGLVIVWQRARQSGFLRFELAGIVLGYLSPLLIAFSKGLGTPIAPVLALAVILAAARRAYHEAARAHAHPRRA